MTVAAIQRPEKALSDLAELTSDKIPQEFRKHSERVGSLK